MWFNFRSGTFGAKQLESWFSDAALEDVFQDDFERCFVLAAFSGSYDDCEKPCEDPIAFSPKCLSAAERAHGASCDHGWLTSSRQGNTRRACCRT